MFLFQRPTFHHHLKHQKQKGFQFCKEKNQETKNIKWKNVVFLFRKNEKGFQFSYYQRKWRQKCQESRNPISVSFYRTEKRKRLGFCKEKNRVCVSVAKEATKYENFFEIAGGTVSFLVFVFAFVQFNQSSSDMILCCVFISNITLNRQIVLFIWGLSNISPFDKFSFDILNFK